MQGMIYGIGVGPGDPELMTLKAARLLREADAIAIPGKEKETCTAYQIALGAVPEIEEKEIIRPQDMIVKSVGNKSGNKIFIIQSIDRKMDFEDIARAKDLDFDELLTEIEGIVNAGTKLDISYYLKEFMDEDKIEDIYLYFKEDAESDSLDAAIEELGADYTEEEIRLVRIKFMCEQGN